jgi:tripartite-type tricarboxylate transporter receptor subunit TctC
VTALLAGDVDMGCLPALSVLSQVRAGKLKAIAVSLAKRSPALPEIPTLSEQGLPGVDAGAWIGVIAPAATPAPILDRLRREIVADLRDSAVVATLRNQLMDVVASTPEEFLAYMREEHDRWTPVIQKAHITLD